MTVLAMQTWVGRGEKIACSVPAFVSVAPDCESAETVLPHHVSVWHSNFCVFI